MWVLWTFSVCGCLGGGHSLCVYMGVSSSDGACFLPGAELHDS